MTIKIIWEGKWALGMRPLRASSDSLIIFRSLWCPGSLAIHKTAPYSHFPDGKWAWKSSSPCSGWWNVAVVRFTRKCIHQCVQESWVVLLNGGTVLRYPHNFVMLWRHLAHGAWNIVQQASVSFARGASIYPYPCRNARFSSKYHPEKVIYFLNTKWLIYDLSLLNLQ